jgi:4a-hydroxytetrahydrobiopterin dehydratase
MKHFVEFPDSLKAIFEFDSFIEAIDFINQVADVAEQVDHHPDIMLTKGKNVTLTISTHEGDKKLTQPDWDLAKKIEEIGE